MEKIGKKLKHDHTLTSILKFAIFSMVMLAPIFSVGSRCLYVICNKNAKDSYSGTWNVDITPSYETNEVNSINDLIVGNIYDFTITSNYNGADINYFRATKIYNITIDTKKIDLDIEQTNDSYLQFTEVANYFLVQSNSKSFYLTDYATKSQLVNATIQFVYYGNFNDTYISSVAEASYIPPSTFSIDTSGTLDNAFEYSLSQLEENEYYNWATNLGIYTPINNMVSGLGGHSVISLLLSYWSIYTSIYIVFDIIITCFVKITHLINGE